MCSSWAFTYPTRRSSSPWMISVGVLIFDMFRMGFDAANRSGLVHGRPMNSQSAAFPWLMSLMAYCATTSTTPAPTTAAAVPNAEPSGPSGPSGPPTTQPGQATGVKRLGGADRIATAIVLSQDVWDADDATSVVLARADTYPDALVGVPLAHARGGPLLLNRRGFATSVACPRCGFVLRCPGCDAPLTYHRAGAVALCHLCGHEERPPSACPDCAFAGLRFRGAGTQTVEAVP